MVENHFVELTDEPTTVYNFQVEDYHTYHVSGLGVLVHNAGDYSNLKDSKYLQRLKKRQIIQENMRRNGGKLNLICQEKNLFPQLKVS